MFLVLLSSTAQLTTSILCVSTTARVQVYTRYMDYMDVSVIAINIHMLLFVALWRRQFYTSTAIRQTQPKASEEIFKPETAVLGFVCHRFQTMVLYTEQYI